MREYNFEEAYRESKRIIGYVSLVIILLTSTLLLNSIVGSVAAVAIALVLTLLYRQVVSALNSPKEKQYDESIYNQFNSTNMAGHFGSNDHDNPNHNNNRQNAPTFFSANIAFGTVPESSDSDEVTKEALEQGLDNSKRHTNQNNSKTQNNTDNFINNNQNIKYNNPNVVNNNPNVNNKNNSSAVDKWGVQGKEI